MHAGLREYFLLSACIMRAPGPASRHLRSRWVPAVTATIIEATSSIRVKKSLRGSVGSGVVEGP